MLKRIALANALLLAIAPTGQAQTTTHLNVPSANMVVLSGFNTLPAGSNGNPTMSWTIYQNGANTVQIGNGAFKVPVGKVLVVTDVNFQTFGGSGQDVLLTLFASNNGIWVGTLMSRTLHNGLTAANQVFPFSLTGGLRIPGGEGLDIGWSQLFVNGTLHLQSAEIVGYYTN